MTRYVLARLVQMVIGLFVVSLIVFFLVRLRGDPISIMAPPTFNAEQVENLRRAWGFDKPLWEQYTIFLGKAITGDFGMSVRSRIPAMELVMSRLWLTYLLAGLGAIIGLVIALPMGVISALKRNSWIDLTATTIATIGTAMPPFWLGLMLILLFSVQLRLLPAFGAQSPAALIMPALTLGLGLASRLSRLTRSSMLEILSNDYILTAKSKGLGTTYITIQHAFRNALLPVVTAFGLQLGWLLGGSVVIEMVFSLPGLGRLMIDSINVRDIAVVQAGLFWFALSFMTINLIIDILYRQLDPRIRY